MPILWALGSLFVGAIAFRAADRLLGNLQDAHRRGREVLGNKPAAVFGAYWEGVAESNLEPYGAEESYWVATGPGIDIAGERKDRQVSKVLKLIATGPRNAAMVAADARLSRKTVDRIVNDLIRAGRVEHGWDGSQLSLTDYEILEQRIDARVKTRR